MSKKVKILVSVLIVAVLLIAGGTATVLAQEEQTQEQPVEVESEPVRYCQNDALLAKVAELLGMTTEELNEVFEQAQQELKDEVIIEYIKKAAENGIITPEEAEEIIEWWKARPEAVDRLLPWSRITPSINSRYMWGNCSNATPGLSLQGNAEQLRVRAENKITSMNSVAQQLQVSNAQCVQQRTAACK
jgi:CO dehydrogenase/acetyl-CoA synthase alpha subunit